jgi:hypothetical protein
MNDPQVCLTFDGPLSWHGTAGTQDIHRAELGRLFGVYVWTIEIESGDHVVYYVGETGRTFAARMQQHFQEHMSGGYHLYEPAKFRQGEKKLLWPGRYMRDDRRTPADFLRELGSLHGVVEDLAFMYRFFVAPFHGDSRLRQRIEAGLADYFGGIEGFVGDFQDKGIRYRRRKPNEEPVPVMCDSQAKVAGLPVLLSV